MPDFGSGPGAFGGGADAFGGGSGSGSSGGYGGGGIGPDPDPNPDIPSPGTGKPSTPRGSFWGGVIAFITAFIASGGNIALALTAVPPGVRAGKAFGSWLGEQNFDLGDQTAQEAIDSSLSVDTGAGPDFASSDLGNYSQDPNAWTNLGEGSNELGVDIPGELDRFTGGVQNIADQYGTDVGTVWDMLLGQQEKYAGIGGDILGGLQDTRTGYREDIANMPGLNINMPDFMGGATVPLAQNAWGDFYSGKADTNLRNLATQGNVAAQTAGIEQNAISNLQNLAGDKFKTGAVTQNLLNLPLNMAFDLLKMDKQQSGNIKSIREQKAPTEDSAAAWITALAALGESL